VELSLLLLLGCYLVLSFFAVYPQGHLNTVSQWAGCLLLFSMVREEVKLRPSASSWIAWAFIVSSLGVVAIGLAPYTGIVQQFGLEGSFRYYSIDARLHSTFQYANTYAVYMLAMWILLAGAALTARRNRIIMPLAGIIGFLYGVTFFLSASRGGFLFAPFALLLILIALNKGQRFAGMLLVAGTMAAGAIAALEVERYARQAEWGSVLEWLALGSIGGIAIGAIAAIWISLPKPIAKIAKSLTVAGAIAIGSWLLYTNVHAISVEDWNVPKKLQRLNPQTWTDTGDGSVPQRIEYYRDALKIIRDYPLTGSGGDGWSRQYPHYQRYHYIGNVTHNHFLQVGVEAGVVGMAIFILFWLFLAAGLFRKASTPMARVFTASALIIGGHSLIDFDLSFYFILLFVAVCAAVSTAQIAKPRVKNRYANLSVGLLAGLLLVVAGTQAWGTYQMANGKSLLDSGNKEAAAAPLEQARAFMPLHPEPHSLLARAKSGTPEQIAHLQEAQRLDPHNPRWHYEHALALSYHKQWAEAYQEAKIALQLQPTVGSYFETVLDTGVQAAIKTVLNGDLQANVYINELSEIERDLRQKQAIAKERRAKYQPKDTPLMSMRAGQALALAGRYDEAIPHLKQANRTALFKPETEIWLYMVYRAQGNQTEMNKLAKKPWVLLLSRNPIDPVLSKASELRNR
jgi:tetratricopeptide (TPR) repeat protein